jgi:flagellar biosynthesis protein FlhA
MGTAAAATGLAIVRAAGGIFLAALELAAPVLAATLLVEIAAALLGKLSPQLPVMALTVPLKTLTGFVILTAALPATAVVRRLADSVRSLIGSASSSAPPVLLCSSPARYHVKRWLEPVLPRLAVLAAGEVPPEIRLRPVGTVR